MTSLTNLINTNYIVLLDVDLLLLSFSKVLETDIDSSPIDSSPTDAQPVPPPRRPAREPAREPIRDHVREPASEPIRDHVRDPVFDAETTNAPPKPPKMSVRAHASSGALHATAHPVTMTSRYHSVSAADVPTSQQQQPSSPPVIDSKHPIAHPQDNAGSGRTAGEDSCNENKTPSRRHRRSSSMGAPPKTSHQQSAAEDMTITSGDPSAHILRRQSFGKKSRRQSRSRDDLASDSSQKPSPSLRSHQRETEFSQSNAGAAPAPADRPSPKLSQSEPVPFDRYHDSRPAPSNHKRSFAHSREASAELLDIQAMAENAQNYSAKLSMSASQPSNQQRTSPTPLPRSNLPSPHSQSRLSRGSLNRFVYKFNCKPQFQLPISFTH